MGKHVPLYILWPVFFLTVRARLDRPLPGIADSVHSSREPESKVQGTLLLDVVVGEVASVLQLLAIKHETLLVRRNPLLGLDLGHDILNSVRWPHLQSNGLASDILDEDLDVVVGQGAPIFQLLD